MAFSKTFPRTVKGSNFPKWEEVSITEEEENIEEERCREENVLLMEECIGDAKKIITRKGLKPYQTDLVAMAVALFEKRASHAIYWKENKAKEKFDALLKKP
jgi:DNA helicase TIP49 (TBP-interacting protein)